MVADEKEKRFKNCVMGSVECLKDEIKARGLKTDSLGSRSFCKGAATYLGAGGRPCPLTSAIP